MDRFSCLRRSRYLAGLFAHLCRLFWRMLNRSLCRLLAQGERAGQVNVLSEISWCGLLRFIHLGAKRRVPHAGQPYEPTKSDWDTPFWQTAVPPPRCQRTVIPAAIQASNRSGTPASGRSRSADGAVELFSGAPLQRGGSWGKSLLCLVGV